MSEKRRMTKVVCSECQIEFLAPLTRVIKGKRKFCSRSCQGKALYRLGLLPLVKSGAFIEQSKAIIAREHLKWGKDETKHPRWKAGNVGRVALHHWVEKHLGKPNKCEFCGLDDPSRRYNWANKSRKYFRDLGDWIRLCHSCHSKYDGSGYKASETRLRNLALLNRV